MSPQTLNQISEWFIKPQYLLEEAKNPIYLGPWELPMLSLQYSQKGLLFKKPTSATNDQETSPINSLVQNLKESLSLTLVHFYPLAGRLATLKQEADPSSYSLYIDCNNSPGARLVHASMKVTISDILSPNEVPEIVYSFFDHNDVINYDGHSQSLLTLQVTELVDGVFVGGSVNHCVADGTSWWHFINTLSGVFKAKEGGQDISAIKICGPHVHPRWCPDGYGPVFSLPISIDPYRLITKSKPPMLKDRVFHFSMVALAKLKAVANSSNQNGRMISTLQALIAFTWRSVTRIRSLPENEITDCSMSVDIRARLSPPLSPGYFGNTIQSIGGKARAGELLANHFGWAAGLLNNAVAQHNDKASRDDVDLWLKSPWLYHILDVNPTTMIRVGSSPRFDMYSAEFGLGKAMAVRSGCTNKFDGKLTLYPGVDGDGSVDMEITLSTDSMRALECDEEFMNVFDPLV